jgi:hypothetical protein
MSKKTDPFSLDANLKWSVVLQWEGQAIIGKDNLKAAEHPPCCYATLQSPASYLGSLTFPHLFPHLGNNFNTYTVRQGTSIYGIPSGTKQ